MSEQTIMKNIEFSTPLELTGLVDYEDGRVVSRTFSQSLSVSLTLFAFDKGEEIGTHSAPGDAMVHILDGEGTITIGDETVVAKTGQVVVMPSDIPPSVTAHERFKMLLILIKKPIELGLGH